MNYVLIRGSKGRYDRPIILEIEDKFSNLKDASDYLINHCIVTNIDVKDAITQCQTFIEDRYGNIHNFNYTDNLLTYYSTGCPSDNEYEGETYKIFNLESKGE